MISTECFDRFNARLRCSSKVGLFFGTVTHHGLPPWRHRVSGFSDLKKFGDGGVYESPTA
jgi:hypothetical protein